MSCDLLPEWLNLFLDDVETTLCLPILLVMVLCTAQFVINHALDIGLTVYQNFMQKSDDEDDEVECGPQDCSENLMSKIKGFFTNVSRNFNGCSNSKLGETATPSLTRSSPQEEEWDYCEEDDDDN